MGKVAIRLLLCVCCHIASVSQAGPMYGIGATTSVIQKSMQKKETRKSDVHVAAHQLPRNLMAEQCRNGLAASERACTGVNETQKKKMTPEERRALRQQIRDMELELHSSGK